MNNADGVLDVIYKPKVVVTFDGTVLWMPPAGKMCTLQQVRGWYLVWIKKNTFWILLSLLSYSFCLYLHHRRKRFSIRRSSLSDEIRLMDIPSRPSRIWISWWHWPQSKPIAVVSSFLKMYNELIFKHIRRILSSPERGMSSREKDPWLTTSEQCFVHSKPKIYHSFLPQITSDTN